MSIKEYAMELRLPYIRNMYYEFIQEAKHMNMDYEEFLTEILKNEVEMRNNNGVMHRIRNAKFTHKKYLEDFKREEYSRDLQKKFKELETLAFIENKENIILISNPGRGKTHYSIGLGIKAVEKERRFSL